MGGGGIAGFKVHLYPTGQQSGKLRLIYNGIVYDEVELKMIADTWYRIRLDLKTVESNQLLVASLFKKAKLQKLDDKGTFNDLDLKGQVRILTFPIRGIPVYIDDVVIKKMTKAYFYKDGKLYYADQVKKKVKPVKIYVNLRHLLMKLKMKVS